MELPDLIKNLYTNKSCDWIKKLDDSTIDPFMIQHWLVMNDAIRVQVRWLDKYVFVLKPKMFVSLAWTIIPKTTTPPFVKFIPKNKQEEKFWFLLERIKKHYELSDNDFNANKSRIIKYITQDAQSMIWWFSYYGIPKKFWKENYLDFNLIKNFNKKELPKTTLDAWGL